MDWNYGRGVDGPDSPRFCPGPAGYMRLWDLFCVSQRRPKSAVCLQGRSHTLVRNSERRAHRRFGGVVLSARSAVSIASNCSRWACFILPDRTAQNCAFRATKAQICRDDLILFWDSLLSAIVRGAEITLLDVTDYGAEVLDTLACVG